VVRTHVVPRVQVFLSVAVRHGSAVGTLSQR
jgi:hypothetical protein